MLKSIKKQWFYTWITKKLRKQFYQLKIVFNCMQTSSNNLWLFKIYFKNKKRMKKFWKKKKKSKKRKFFCDNSKLDKTKFLGDFYFHRTMNVPSSIQKWLFATGLLSVVNSLGLIWSHCYFTRLKLRKWALSTFTFQFL